MCRAQKFFFLLSNGQNLGVCPLISENSLHFTTDNFSPVGGVCLKNISHFTTDRFLANGGVHLEKISLHLTTDILKLIDGPPLNKICFLPYNGHFFIRIHPCCERIAIKKRPRLFQKRERSISANIRFLRIASTAGVYTHGENERPVS